MALPKRPAPPGAAAPTGRDHSSHHSTRQPNTPRHRQPAPLTATANPDLDKVPAPLVADGTNDHLEPCQAQAAGPHDAASDRHHVHPAPGRSDPSRHRRGRRRHSTAPHAPGGPHAAADRRHPPDVSEPARRRQPLGAGHAATIVSTPPRINSRLRQVSRTTGSNTAARLCEMPLSPRHNCR